MRRKNFTAIFEYKTPETESVGSELLTASEEAYKGFIEYLLPIKQEMTKEAGVLTYYITFLLNTTSEDGQQEAIVRKTQYADLPISPAEDWNGDLPDSALNVVEQKILELQKMQHSIEEMQEKLEATKADNLTYEDDTL